MSRLATAIGAFPLRNPVIRGAGDLVMTEAGIRAALRAGVAGVIAKSVNEQPAVARQLEHADYDRLDPDGVPTSGQDISLLNRSGLIQRDITEWFGAIAALDRDATRDDGLSPPVSSMLAPTAPRQSRSWRATPVCGSSN